jgi:hypothetical protein
LTLGGGTSIRLEHRIVEAAKENPNVPFHSVDERCPLIDFLYQDEDGAFHAFQATVGKERSADREKIVGPGKKLSKY